MGLNIFGDHESQSSHKKNNTPRVVHPKTSIIFGLEIGFSFRSLWDDACNQSKSFIKKRP